jgi:hypothetical protein
MTNVIVPLSQIPLISGIRKRDFVAEFIPLLARLLLMNLP